jgi:hypothetical protein
MAELYPQTLGSVFVASYDLQSYGGRIRTHLCTELVYTFLLVFAL